MSTITHRIKDHKTVPRGGEYVAVHPETKVAIKARNFPLLYKAMVEHCKANNLPIPLGFEDKVEEWICQSDPDACEQYVQDLPLRPRIFGWQDVLRGTRVMLAHWWNGRTVVSQEEANRRAAICKECPLNSTIQYGCTGLCGELKELLATVAGSKQTPFDGELKSCAICHCFNAVAVWVDRDLQWQALSPEMREAFGKVDWCWKRG